MRRKNTADEFISRPIKAIVFGDGRYSRCVWGRLLQGLNDNNIESANCVIVRDKPQDKNARQFNGYSLSFKKGAKEIVREIDCVTKVLDAYTNYNEFSDLSDNSDITTILWAPEKKNWYDRHGKIKNDKNTLLALLTMLLFRRFCQEKRGFEILSAVNEDRNGEVLRNEIVEYASVRGLGMDFVNWLTMEAKFINTFIETRVGNEKIDSTLTVDGERYFLCVLDKKDKLISLSDKVMINEELSSYYIIRRHIYEGALCSACAYALLHDIPTLDQFMLREKLVKHMTVSVFEEIIPALNVNFETVQAYTVEMLQRFEDASVSVRFIDYAENLGEKVKESIIPLIRQYAESYQKLPKHMIFTVFCTIKMYNTLNINDEFSKDLAYSSDHYSEIWGEDITYIKKEIEQFEKKLG